jgi:hypothetical protein
MARRGSLNIVELHFEKALLGLAVVFVIALGVMFMMMESNTIDYGGNTVGPDELDRAILQKAESLRNAVENAHKRQELDPVPKYAERLRATFSQDLFAAARADEGPPLPEQIPVQAVFNAPLPDLEGDEKEEDVRMVTPLAPTPPQLRTGISLAVRHQHEINSTELGPGVPPIEDLLPVELSWVSLGAYFPEKAQRDAMTAAGWAGYRAKVIFSGFDVQRQEMTASGDFGPWINVSAGPLMPQVQPPQPAFDALTGEVLNQKPLDDARDTLQRAQPQIVEPPFYVVEAGDRWIYPPLDGYAFSAETEFVPVEDSRAGGGAMQPPGGGMRPPGGDDRGRRPGGPPPGGPPGGRPPGGGPPPGQPPAGEDLSKVLRDARTALMDGELDRAERLAESVLQDDRASRQQERLAQRILDGVKQKRERAGDAAAGDDEILLTEPVIEDGIVVHPETGEPAIWWHDVSVEPGKTYRYRVRARLWNRYVGRRAALRNPERAADTILVGEWSLPSAPITVAPKRHFFVVSPNFGEPAASVDVFTWHRGNWLREKFNVKIGETIGGPARVKTGALNEAGRAISEEVDFSTGALVLDLRIDEPVMYRRAAGRGGEFSYTDTEGLVLVYLDPADGQVKQRISNVDRAEPLYKRLKDEWDAFKDSL